MIQPQIDFCCFRLVAINIALTHCYKLVSFLNLIRHITQISAPVWGYSELSHLKASDVFPQTDPVAIVTKNR